MRRATTNSVDLYLSLREVNAAPFAGYIDLGYAQVISASPERFLQVVDQKVQSRQSRGLANERMMPHAMPKSLRNYEPAKKIGPRTR